MPSPVTLHHSRFSTLEAPPSSRDPLQRLYSSRCSAHIDREVETFEPGRSVHGQFGSTADWNLNPDLQRFATEWLHANTSSLSDIARSIVVETRTTVSAADLVRYAQHELDQRRCRCRRRRATLVAL